MYTEIIAVCSEIQTKHTNTLCGLNLGFFNVKTGGNEIVITSEGQVTCALFHDTISTAKVCGLMIEETA